MPTLIIGKTRVNAQLIDLGSRTEVISPFCRPLIDELKSAFKGARWNPEKKVWSIENCSHNDFQLKFLRGENPYARYDEPLPEIVFPKRALLTRGELKLVDVYGHQQDMTRHILGRRQVAIAGEMGVGKTLAAILAMELCEWKKDEETMWWVGSRSSLAAFKVEQKIWGTKVRPQTMTYDGLVKACKAITGHHKVPAFIVFDESQYIKNPDSQRSQAAFYIAEAMRETFGDKCYIVLMTGSPAPNSPMDWYHQCEVAQPGFLKEGDKFKFQNRLGLFVQEQSQLTGCTFPKRVTWWDDANKCKECGKPKEEHVGLKALTGTTTVHKFESSINEVDKLYRRMNGLVIVKFKKHCLDLPEKQFRIFRCDVSPSTQRAADLIRATAKNAMMALTLLRELSDGFQYVKIPTSMQKCPLCEGRKVIRLPEPMTEEEIENAVEPVFNEEICSKCTGQGEVPHYENDAQIVKSPKMDVIEDMLDEHTDVRRLVTWAGFTGSIDLLTAKVKQKGWEYVRVDGRGWHTSLDVGRNNKPEDLLDIFQNDRSESKICYVGHPGSGGVGVTLTASPTSIYYSNDFIPVNRIQSMDRIHRPGMDVNRGATIVDIFHLPSDEYIYNKLEAKRALQDISLGAMWEEIKAIKEREQ